MLLSEDNLLVEALFGVPKPDLKKERKKLDRNNFSIFQPPGNNMTHDKALIIKTGTRYQ